MRSPPWLKMEEASNAEQILTDLFEPAIEKHLGFYSG
jgi:hypothetical protein